MPSKAAGEQKRLGPLAEVLAAVCELPVQDREVVWHYAKALCRGLELEPASVLRTADADIRELVGR